MAHMRIEDDGILPGRDTWKGDYDQRDLLFWISVFREYQETEICLRDLRQHFPNARVIVRSDGDDDHRYQRLKKQYDVDVRFGERLFTIENGGAIVQRMIADLLATQQTYLFKIDPDTVAHRAFRYLPLRDGIFGTLQGGKNFPAIQGGCLGLTRSAAECLFKSDLLMSNSLTHPEIFERTSDYWRIMAQRARRVGLASFDWSIGWAATELRLPIFDFPEVHCKWKETIAHPGERYAFTHPRPDESPRHELDEAAYGDDLQEATN